VQPEAVWKRLREGGDTLLVCAYEDEQKCRANLLEGAITLADLQQRLPALDAKRNLVFYCA
jgi:hypothetical protein